MNWFWRLYRASEQTFWNTLTKKLSSLFLIAGFQLASLLYCYTTFSTMRHELNGTLANDIDHALFWLTTLFGLSLLFIAFMVWYLRHLIVHPIRQVTANLDEIGVGASNLAQDLLTVTYDEIRDLSIAYNRFLGKMRALINHVSLVTVRIAIDPPPRVRTLANRATAPASRTSCPSRYVARATVPPPVSTRLPRRPCSCPAPRSPIWTSRANLTTS